MTPITATLVNASTALVPAVDIVPVAPPGADKITTGVGYVLWGVAIACFIGILFVAYKMSLTSGSSHAGHGVGKGLAMVMGALILASSASAIVAAFLTF